MKERKLVIYIVHTNEKSGSCTTYDYIGDEELLKLIKIKYARELLDEIEHLIIKD